MTLKIEKNSDGQTTVLHLSGRMQAGHIDQLTTVMADDRSRIVLDLAGVTLVYVDVVRFLNACEDGNVEIIRCLPYIREWMTREGGGK